eukprot:EG_transcript_12333
MAVSFHNMLQAFIDDAEGDWDCSGACPGDVGVRTIAQSLSNSTLRVTKLMLQECGIGPCGAVVVATVLLRPGCPLQVLDLSDNPLGSYGAAVIAVSLCGQSELHTLIMDGCGIQDDGAVSIGLCLEYVALRRLSLSRNQIGEPGAQILVNGIRPNKSLQKLNIQDNQVDKEMMNIVQSVLSSKIQDGGAQAGRDMAGEVAGVDA